MHAGAACVARLWWLCGGGPLRPTGRPWGACSAGVGRPSCVGRAVATRVFSTQCGAMWNSSERFHFDGWGSACSWLARGGCSSAPSSAPGHVGLQPRANEVAASRTRGCSLQHKGLQPRAQRGCSLEHKGLQPLAQRGCSLEHTGLKVSSARRGASSDAPSNVSSGPAARNAVGGDASPPLVPAAVQDRAALARSSSAARPPAAGARGAEAPPPAAPAAPAAAAA